MFRLLTAISVILSISGLPMLCAGGLITHDCECPESPDSHSEEDGHDDGQCGHETSCNKDPCTIIAARPDDCHLVLPGPMQAASLAILAAYALSDLHGVRLFDTPLGNLSNVLAADAIGRHFPLRI